MNKCSRMKFLKWKLPTTLAIIKFNKVSFYRAEMQKMLDSFGGKCPTCFDHKLTLWYELAKQLN
jgi:hypothetical protein